MFKVNYATIINDVIDFTGHVPLPVFLWKCTINMLVNCLLVVMLFKES